MKYIVKEIPFTQKHKAFNVELDNGKFVARFSKKSNADNFARYMNDNQIFSRSQWESQPIKVKQAFVMSTMEVAPNFYQ